MPSHNLKSNLDWDFDDVFKVSSRELVHPQLSHFEKSEISDMLLEDLRSFVNEKSIAPYSNMSDEQFETEVEKVFPKYMLYDTYNLNVTPVDGMKIGETDENNQWLFDFLMNKASEYYMKAITENNPHNSFVYSSELVQQLLLLYQQQNPQGPGNDGEGKSGEGKSGMQKMLEKMMQDGNKSGNAKLDQAIQQAQANAQEKIEKAEAQGKDSGELGCSKDLGDLTLGELSEFMDYQKALEHIKLDSHLVNSFIKTTLKLSKAYFSSKYKEYQLEMLEADVLDDLQGVENLHPALRAVNLDEVVTHDRTYHMKFDVYIDISGSMGSNIYHYNPTTNEQVNITGLDLAKITAIKLRNLGYVADVYPFESHVHPELKDNHAIALMHCSGGTNINNVVSQVANINRPSVVITDMEDHISIHDSNVYFIGILGANFNQFKNQPAGKQYLKNQQCIKYTNKNTFEVVV